MRNKYNFIVVLVLVLLFGSASSYAQNEYYLDFDGSNDYIKYYNDASLQLMDGATDFTIEAWIFPISGRVAKYDRILQRYYSFSLIMYDGNDDGNVEDWYFTYYDSGASSWKYINTSGDATLHLNAWNHIAVICNSSDNTTKLYVDGVDVTNGTPTAATLNTHSSDNLYIGQRGSGASYFGGYIDEIRLKNTAETPANLHSKITDTEYASDANTAALFHLNEGTGSSILNEANSVNGTLFGVNWRSWRYESSHSLPLNKRYMWNGGASTDWTAVANWDAGVMPTLSDDIIIPAFLSNYPTIMDAENVNSLTIEAGAEFTVGSTGSLATGSAVVINSDATGSGSLIVAETGSITASGKKSSTINPPNVHFNYYLKGNKWHLFGTTASGQSIKTIIEDVDNHILNDGTNYDMKAYDEGTDQWGSLFTIANVDDMTSGQGYAIRRDGDGNINVRGTLVNADVPVSLTTSLNGWNLLSNPYTSAIQAKADGDEYCLLNTANIAELDPAEVGLYLWEEGDDYPATNYYKVLNNAGDGGSTATTHIQAGQAFFVKANPSGGSTGMFTMSTTMQEHQSSIPLYKSESDAWPTIKLNASISNAKANTTITFNSMMTKGLDISYDAGLLNSYPEFALYSRLIEDYKGIDFMLQALPKDYENLVVPIGLDAKAGEIVTFSAQCFNIPEEYAVVLEDRAMQTFTNLSDGEEYAVQLNNDSKGTGRFFIRTSMKSALGIGDLDKKEFQVFTSVNNHQLVIRGEATANTLARIYTITGEQLALINLDQATEQAVQFDEESGVYIIRFSNEKGSYTQKFSWIK